MRRVPDLSVKEKAHGIPSTWDTNVPVCYLTVGQCAQLPDAATATATSHVGAFLPAQTAPLSREQNEPFLLKVAFVGYFFTAIKQVSSAPPNPDERKYQSSKTRRQADLQWTSGSLTVPPVDCHSVVSKLVQ